MLRAMLLSRPKPPQAGAEGQPLQGHRSQRQLSTKVSGPPLAAASTPGRRAELTASACEIHPLKIQKSHQMGRISSARVRRDIPFKGVFQCHANASQIDAIKEKILDLANQCIVRHGVNANLPYIDDGTRKLDHEYRRAFTAMLYCDSFAPRDRKSPTGWSGTIADILAWKWSEATGKLIGCPFWSVAAKDLFDREKSKRPVPWLEDAWRLAKRLNAKRLYGQPRDRTERLVHEHVFPKKFFCKHLLELQKGICDIDKLRGIFSRLAVACVVLEVRASTE